MLKVDTEKGKLKSDKLKMAGSPDGRLAGWLAGSWTAGWLNDWLERWMAARHPSSQEARPPSQPQFFVSKKKRKENKSVG